MSGTTFWQGVSVGKVLLGPLLCWVLCMLGTLASSAMVFAFIDPWIATAVTGLLVTWFAYSSLRPTVGVAALAFGGWVILLLLAVIHWLLSTSNAAQVAAAQKENDRLAREIDRMRELDGDRSLLS
jgi:hypothetical protein